MGRCCDLRPCVTRLTNNPLAYEMERHLPRPVRVAQGVRVPPGKDARREDCMARNAMAACGGHAANSRNMVGDRRPTHYHPITRLTCRDMKKSELLEREILSHLEKKLLDEVIRPAITAPKDDRLWGTRTVSETLNFADLLNGVKEFYRRNNGDISHWNRLMLEVRL